MTKDNRTEYIHWRLTPTMKEAIRGAAAAEGKGMSGWLEAAVQTALKRRPRKTGRTVR